MSHFAVVVVTKDYPTKDVLTEALQPYHEYECTGIRDQYVIPVDQTEDALSAYETDTTRFLIDLEGNKHSPYIDGEYDPRFLRPATPYELENCGMFGDDRSVRLVRGPLGYDKHVFVLPEGWRDEYLPSKENGVSFIDFMDSYYGVKTIIREGEELPEDEDIFSYAVTDADGNFLKYFKVTNPNKKWDWWSIGGRYTGRFDVAYDPEKDPRNLEPNRFKRNPEDPDLVPKWVKVDSDQFQKSSFNLEKIMDHHRAKQSETFDKYREAINGIPHFLLWDEIETTDIDKKREQYHSQLGIAALRKVNTWIDSEEIRLVRENLRENFINSVSSSWVAPYAFVHEGKWYQKGEMGWFGVSHGDIDQMDWHDQFMGMIDSLEPTDWLTVVDCHI